MSTDTVPTTTTENSTAPGWMRKKEAYTNATRICITVNSVSDGMSAWYELCDTLAFLADVTGARANEKGLVVSAYPDIPLSSDGGDIGEIYVRAAALARCHALASSIGPEQMIFLHEEATKATKKEKKGASHE